MLKHGTMLGPNEILSLIGAGGMGEVYKARDTRLDRFVAIKTLPAHLADRPELRERFKREAHTLANLKHAHICTLYDIGHQELVAEDFDGGGVAPRLPWPSEPAGSRRTVGIDYLVMEYLEGETLAERLKKGPLPLDQVLRYADELADALTTAHRQSFTHRDIKPGNIMLTKEGSKLLDFGLAKLKQEIAHAITPPSERPTAPGTLTQQGTLLGTLQYMAPEQVEGKVDDVDGRTDVFAFGAVVYEMATGKKAFEGQTQASVIAAILKGEPPPMSSLQPMTPPQLERVIRRCLAKEQDERWQTAFDLWHALKWVAQDSAQPAPPQPAVSATVAAQPARASRRRVLLWSGVALVVAALASLAVWTLKPTPAQPVTRTTITLPPGQRLAALDQPAIAISPDGKNLVYVAVQAGTQQLFLRPLDSLESKPIAGTEGAVAPFFSPDGQWVGFFAGGKLKKVSVNGGAAVTLANAPTANAVGASWSSQGTVAFQPTAAAAQGLQQISQEGGVLQLLTKLGRGETVHGWPEFLPGSKAVLFAGSRPLASWNNAQIAVQAEGGERKNLAQGTQPRYAATGHLLYTQSGTLMAAPFDARRLALTGAAVPAIEGVMQSNTTGAAQYSISPTGTLVYLAGGVAASQSRLVWVSRKGEEQPLPAPPHNYIYERVSPDGRRAAVAILEQETQVWVYDLSRDTLTRLTFEGSVNANPTWSPDGRRIAFGSDRGGPRNLFWQAADGGGGAERLTTSEYTHAANSFSPDGQLLAFIEINPETGRDIWVLNLKDHKAQLFLKTPYDDTGPKFSPDGKWLAYSSDESGRREVYVQPYPGPGGKWQISTDGGQEPVWNPKGGELFYRSGNKIMAVDVDTKSGFSAGKPRMLFEGPYLPTSGSLPYYDVSPDGQRFLMLKPVESQASAPTQINVVLNWFEELKRRVPAAR